MRCLLVMLLGIGLPLASIEAATVYRTTDAQGNVVFTDKPIEGGQRIELQSLTVIPSAEPASSSDAAEPRKKASSTSSSSSSRRVGGPFMPYSTFRIASPEDGYTLQTGYAGDIAVDIGVEPALRKDHRIRLLVDGEVSQSAMHTQAFLLNGLNRGEHTLRAELLDAQGRVRHRSEPVTLYVHRASVNLPSNPNNPAGRPPGKTGN
ncbi:protein of unknown function [Modicisalibacter ilicicola DSM 19980]|uniref:DUF4124 domain-containing protein n=2 Tax=Modicisalibacter ilicicola TaxID=480814 RepID=A0A1M5BE56_9GAMM|nr:protein of unknown function [Halomonas ilicicola DSM 19980]